MPREEKVIGTDCNPRAQRPPKKENLDTWKTQRKHYPHARACPKVLEAERSAAQILRHSPEEKPTQLAAPF